MVNSEVGAVLRIVRGDPDAEEIAALVVALAQAARTTGGDTGPAPERPRWFRGHRNTYRAPGSWAAGG
ncbi:MAG: acyl-CoA carboxylase subunit epsilon [Nocardiopsis sp. BM-2018]|uniref:Acyl-CoA carboxylase subunit epsilon n=1 Tax=Nocardiopsis metallicus TaxID=179819 RepID=A0A840WEE3_9ACTN|nr:acyl-CoA carboxylase epsilon subunit [Nocardiopsis metallicus]MBB5489706.1 hypothetical protein [Nocardiopsis metallicus]QRN80769.1 MAG: acyl-CoA carboxylase subunit epsilon [Nocardiopsis sp. BM-2018]